MADSVRPAGKEGATADTAVSKAEGAVYTCLFATRGTDLREVLRAGASDEVLDDVVSGLWTNRADRYSETRWSQTTGLHKVEMSHIGG